LGAHANTALILYHLAEPSVLLCLRGSLKGGTQQREQSHAMLQEKVDAKPRRSNRRITRPLVVSISPIHTSNQRTTIRRGARRIKGLVSGVL